MQDRHDFELLQTETALWVDIENQAAQPGHGRPWLRVDEVCLHVWSEKHKMFRRVCRYFEVTERDRLTTILLRHYEGLGSRAGGRPQIIERAGVWVGRQR